MQENKINLNTPILYAIIIGIGMFLGYKMKGTLLHDDIGGGGGGKVDEIMNLVKQRYVDSVATDSVEMKAIENLLSQLDPHSVYIPPSELKEVADDMKGEFDGIGIEYFMQKDTLMVTSVIAGGPSVDAGIQTGDKFIKVGDSIIAGKKITTDGIVKYLRGANGSKVKISVLRNKKMINDITVTRGTIPMYSVDAGYMVSATVGYIKINRFAENTHTEFVEKLKLLQNAGMQKLIIDVRDNPGGYLETAVDIIDEMIDGKKKIVYTKGRDKKDETFNSGKNGLFETGKIAVLVDEGSASAAEILSGALQDYDRATIIGRRTFGKGLVQEQYPLSNGGALRLTIARYYIPSGRCIQKDYSKGIDKYQDDVVDRYKHGELNSKDSIVHKDSTVYKTLGGRRVYGGGGITPDVFVPLGNSKFDKTFSDILGTGYLTEIVNDYFINHKDELKKYKSIADFIKSYTIDATIITQLKTQCSKDGIATNCLGNKAEKQMIDTRIKAQISKALFGASAQYQIINQSDEAIKIAIQQLGQ
jgi:carboxyl-terminal processing protease